MDDKKLLPLVPRDVLVGRGISAVAYFMGGNYLLLMTAGQRGILGLILPVVALVVGVAALLSRDKDDKKPGLFFAAAGVLGVLTRFVPLFRPFGGFILGLGGVGLLAAGIWKGVGFLLGLKRRG